MNAMKGGGNHISAGSGSIVRVDGMSSLLRLDASRAFCACSLTIVKVVMGISLYATYVVILLKVMHSHEI